jgi:hypothetical protein
MGWQQIVEEGADVAVRVLWACLLEDTGVERAWLPLSPPGCFTLATAWLITNLAYQCGRSLVGTG